MRDKTPKVGIVVVSWNNADILAECFDSVKNQEYKNIRTVLVDNKSSDKSVEFTKNKYPWVEIIESPSNLGFAKGNNVAIKMLLEDHELEYIVLLNSDARLSNNWVSTMIDFAVKKPKGAVLQGTTLDYYDHEVIDSTHIYIAKNGQATQGSWRTLYQGEIGPLRVFGVNAAACLISRHFIDKQPFDNLFDESFFMYLEDVDVSTRAIIMGWENYHVANAIAYHMGSASSGKNPGFSLYMTYRNNLAMLYKNMPLTIFIRMFPGIVKSDYHTIKGLIKDGKGTATRSLLKGRFVGIFRFPMYYRKRKKLRRITKIDNTSLWLLMNSGFKR